MTANDIVEMLAEIDGIGVSRTTIQKIVNETISDAVAFNNEPIEDCPFVYLDASYVPFKRSIGLGKSVEKEGILVALGITPQGYKRVLGYVIGETENIESWRTLLKNLKERGLVNPRLFISDGLSGMPIAIKEVFPKAQHQRCIVHYMRNLGSYVRRTERQEICEAFKQVYSKETKEEALKAFEEFKSLWGHKYLGLKRMLNKTDETIFSYYCFPREIRKSLYTSNTIEGFNAKLKRETQSES